MEKSLTINGIPKSLLYDSVALTFIYFMPVLSHLTSFPLYILEPMRIAVLVAVIHTNRFNTYLVALTLPVFSFFASSHPVLLKTILITAELMINVSLFYIIFIRNRNPFLAMFISIMTAKVFYYLVKFVFLSFNLVQDDLFSTPLLIQFIISVGISIYAAWIFNEKIKKLIYLE